MKNFNDKSIEEAFAKIRASFEKRNNDTGLEILDSYEERWTVTGDLSDPQIAWLERQLDGSWRRTERQSTNEARSDFNNRSQESDVAQIPTQGIDQLFDVMVRQKLADEGKALVDLARLNELEQAVEDLRQLVSSLK